MKFRYFFSGLLLVVSCGACGTAEGPPTSSAASVNDCAARTGPIEESTEFTSYDSQVTHGPYEDRLLLEVLRADLPVPAGAPTVLGELEPLMVGSDSEVSVVAYGDPASIGSENLRAVSESASRSAAISAGLIMVFVRTGASESDSTAQAMLGDPRLGDRVTAVSIGDEVGALTWEDPDADDLRPHNLVWLAAGSEFRMVGDASAEQMVDLARATACG